MNDSSLDLNQEVKPFIDIIEAKLDEKQDNNDFQIILKWSKITNKVKLFQVIPNCWASATIWKLIREVEYEPILQLIERVTEEVKLITFNTAEIYEEAISATKGRVIFDFDKL